MKVWIDGGIVDAEAARVSPFDHAVLTGDGVFETLRIYNGVPFAPRRHLERLAHSANGLGLAVPEVDLRRVMRDVIAANALVDGRVRITLTGGDAPLGSDRGDAPPRLIVAATTMKPWPPTTEVVIVPWSRNEHSAIAGLKTVSYAENVVALAYARERGAGEALFLNTAGNLCEGTGTNVFAVVGGELTTPPLSSGCLAGVTRSLVIELTGAVERDITPAQFEQASERFLTGTTREVHPIGQAGPVTLDASTRFRQLVARDIDP